MDNTTNTRNVTNVNILIKLPLFSIQILDDFCSSALPIYAKYENNNMYNQLAQILFYFKIIYIALHKYIEY